MSFVLVYCCVGMLMTSCFGGSTPILGRKRITLLQPVIRCHRTKHCIFTTLCKTCIWPPLKYITVHWKLEISLHFDKLCHLKHCPFEYDCRSLSPCKWTVNGIQVTRCNLASEWKEMTFIMYSRSNLISKCLQWGTDRGLKHRSDGNNEIFYNIANDFLSIPLFSLSGISSWVETISLYRRTYGWRILNVKSFFYPGSNKYRSQISQGGVDFKRRSRPGLLNVNKIDSWIYLESFISWK